MEWLMLAAVYFGWKGKWSWVFLSGLLMDLIKGGRLGQKAVIYLLVAAATRLGKVFWPMRTVSEVKLKID